MRFHPTLAAAALFIGAATVVTSSAPLEVGAATTTVYVGPGGNDGNGGGDPGDALRSIGEAVRIAPDGATIMIADGIYHETVQVFQKAVHLRATGSGAVMDGARAVTGWTRESGTDRWYTTGWTPQFPRNESVFVDPAAPEAAYPDQVFLDGIELRQVTTRSAVAPDSFYHDEGADRLYLGVDPTDRRVEASALPWALYLNRADGSTVRGLTVRRYATPSRDLAAVRAFGDDLLLSDVTVRNNAFNGISVIGDRVTIADSWVRGNGHTGIHGHLSSDVTIRSTTIERNNAAKFDATHAAGGTKFTNSSGLRYERNTVRSNGGPGIWTDISSFDIDVVSNLIENNARAGVELELTGRADVIDNIVTGNGEAGIYVLESNDVRVWHNLATDNARDIWALEGPRTSGGLPAAVLWDLRNVSIRANAVGGSGRGEEALLAADDWTENRSAASMNVTSDANLIWKPPSSTVGQALRWAMWPAPLAWTSDLGQYRSRTGQEGASQLLTGAADPYRTGPAVYTPPAGAPTGPTLPGDLATLVGVGANARYPAGPISGFWTEVVATDGIDAGADAGSTARRSARPYPLSP